MNQGFKNRYVFGEFCLDGAERQLSRNGTVISLPPKIFDTLLLLVENAGHLIEKEDFMKRLWPGTFVGEDALARNISILRKTLGESGDSQSFIATVPTRGYRFAAAVQEVGELETRPSEDYPANPATQKEKESAGEQPETLTSAKARLAIISQPAASRARRRTDSWERRIAFAILVLAVGSFAGLTTFYVLSPTPVPRVIRAVQLTHSGRVEPWTSLVSDGVRVYFNERDGDHWNLMQTSLAGGESQVVLAPFQNTVVRDISPDHSNLLIATFERLDAPMRLWIWPVQGGAPRRIGDITARDAAWYPNGREIIYAGEEGIYLATTNGTTGRKFLSTEGRPGIFTWSPDGRFLRFTTWTGAASGSAMWEVHSDGTSLRHLLPGWITLPDECCGSWTPDGKYFLFDSKHSGSRDIWAIQETASPFLRRQAEPIRITVGPTDFAAPLVSKDGHKALVYGTNFKNEFLRYDMRSRQFHQLFPETLMRNVAFSDDGEWVAYISQRDSSLVRMKPDGTQRLTIAHSSFDLGLPRWSPDSRKIAFRSLRPSSTYAIFLVSLDGGAPKDLVPNDGNQLDPTWSPDGKLLAFAREEAGPTTGKLSDSI